MANFNSSGSRTAFFAFFILTAFLQTILAQNTTSNTTVQAVPYFAIFDTEVYGDGSGVDPSKNLNNPVVAAINVPEGQDNQDLYIHFSAPADKHSWAAFGLGGSMKGALMFVVYRSANNTKDVTVSPRIGSGHVMPTFTSDVQVNVLELTGVDSNNRFVVNMHCTNCRKWNGGSLTISNKDDDKTSPMFYALGPDVDLASDDKEAKIQQHSRFSEIIDGNFVPTAAGVPIVAEDPSEPRVPTGNGQGNIGGGGDSSYGGPVYSVALHAFFMCFAFALVFPGGYLLLRMFERVALHWLTQSIGALCVLAGFGAGIRASVRGAPGFTHPHQIIGFIVVFLVLSAWTLGLVGHRIYKRTQTRSPFMKVHRVIGPTAILLGFVNACIGLAWAGMTRAIIGYSLFNVFVAIVVGSLVFWKKKRDIRKAATNTHAASNFREGQVEHGFGQAIYGNAPPPGYGGHNDVPMYTIHPNK